MKPKPIKIGDAASILQGRVDAIMREASLDMARQELKAVRETYEFLQRAKA